MNQKLDRIIELLESIDRKLSDKPKRKSEGKGTLIRDSYEEFFRQRYNQDPVRNKMVNGMFAGISARVPEEDYRSLVEFFFRQTDSWYLREMHHPRCLLKDCEILLTRMKTGLVMTGSKARMIEKTADNLKVAQDYLAAKGKL